jgi:hypothetical protein
LPLSAQTMVSRDGSRVAIVLRNGDRHDLPSRKPRVPSYLRIVSLYDGSSVEYELALARVRMLNWLDDDNVMLVARKPERDNGVAALFRLDAETGEAIELREIPYGLPIAHVEGPREGPWLVSRSGRFVEAWRQDGKIAWKHDVATLDSDTDEVRRWAIVDGEVVGIDTRGRWWRRPVPWGEEP